VTKRYLFFGFAGKRMGRFAHSSPQIWEAAFTENIDVFQGAAATQTAGIAQPSGDCHSSLSRPPIDHVHGSLHGHDAEPVQKLLEGLTF
jgi:hypothetical protein